MSTTVNLSSPTHHSIEFTSFMPVSNDSPSNDKKLIALMRSVSLASSPWRETMTASHTHSGEFRKKFAIITGNDFLLTPEGIGLPKDTEESVDALMTEDFMRANRHLLVGSSFDPARYIWNVAEALISGTVWFAVGIRYAAPASCPLLSVILEGKVWKLFYFHEHSCCIYVPQAIQLAFIGGCIVGGMHVVSATLPLCSRVVQKARSLFDFLTCNRCR